MFEEVILDLFKQHSFLYDLKSLFIGMSGMIGSKNGWIEVPICTWTSKFRRY